MVKRFISKPSIQFFYRFTAVHVLTYLVFGILFMLLSNYFQGFAEDPIMRVVMKPSDALSVQLAPLVQIIRGLLLALVIYPFRATILEKPYGWLKLFGLMYVLTSIGAVITGPGSIEGFLYTNFNYNILIGVPEITVQMLVFSWVFCKWHGANKKMADNSAI